MDYDILRLALSEHPYPLIFVTISGSHLYGFPSPDSDYDLRGMHVTDLKQVIGLQGPEETIEEDYVEHDVHFDIVTHDVAFIAHRILGRGGNYLDQIYSPLVLHTTPEHNTLKQLTQDALSRQFAYHYGGLARSMWHRLQKDEQPRVKPLLYVYRSLLSGIHLMNTGEVLSNIIRLNEVFGLTYIPTLIDMKHEEQAGLEGVDMAFHEAEFERLQAALEQAVTNSPLPDRPPQEAVDALNNWLVKVRLA